ncbi:MAG: hypothetical protein ACRDM9_03720 [Gaiellaceae bacterium]
MSASAPAVSLLDAAETRRYLEDTVRVWLGLPAGAGVEPPALPERLARLLMRVEEYENAHRDRWGRWEFGFSENFHAGCLWVPEVDRWVAERRAELAPATALEPLWPGGRRFAVCLTHDVDLVSLRSTPRQIVRYARAGLARDGTTPGRQLLRLARPPVRIARSLRSGIARVPSTRETLERSVALEAERGAVASYLFTVPPSIGRSRYDCVYSPGDACLFRGARRRVADVMRTLADEGFDVGLHGSYGGGAHPGALAAERAALERATGLRVTTTRQHLLHWDARWTPRLQAEAGLRVDSSLGFNRNVGFRAGTSLPFRHFDVAARRPLELLEVPLVVQDVALLGSYGLELDVALACSVVRELVDSAASVGGAVTLSFHPDKLVQPEWLSLYEWSLDYAVAHEGWLTSLARLEEWWRGRAARVLGG